jgi:hypothetical protein
MSLAAKDYDDLASDSWYRRDGTAPRRKILEN